MPAKVNSDVDPPDQSEISGGEALAWGVIEAGVQYVTGHPGSPGSAVVDELLRLDPPHMRIEWGAMSDPPSMQPSDTLWQECVQWFVSRVWPERSAGLVDGKQPGWRDGGFVILTGDDPGGWGSQNEEDSRPIIAAAEIPMLEPSTPGEGRRVIKLAYELAERIKTPVAVRVTQAMSKDMQVTSHPLTPSVTLTQARFQRQDDRWTVTPTFVVSYHQKLIDTLQSVRVEFEDWDLNQFEGEVSWVSSHPAMLIKSFRMCLPKARHRQCAS